MLMRRIILLAMLGLDFGFSMTAQEQPAIIDLLSDESASESEDSPIASAEQDERVAASLQLKEAVIAHDVNEVARLLRTYDHFDFSFPLCHAIEMGYAQIVRLILRTKKVGANTGFCRGETVDGIQQYTMNSGHRVLPLRIAIEKKKNAVARLLIDAGANVNARWDAGKSLLYEAAYFDNFDAVKLLVEKRIKIRGARWSRWSPLEWAVWRGNMEMLQFLFSHGFRLSEPKESFPAAHAAAECGACNVLRYLLQQKHDLATYPNPNSQGDTPLHRAAEMGRLGCVKLLLEEYNVPIDALNKQHFTPLMSAAMHGRMDVVRYLVNRGACLDQCSKVGHNTALALARQNSQRDVVEFLSRLVQGRAEEQLSDDDRSEDSEPSEGEGVQENKNRQQDDGEMQCGERDRSPVVNPEADNNLRVSSPSIEESLQDQDQNSADLNALREECMQKIEAGNILSVNALLHKNKALAQHGDGRGYTLLHHAACHGKHTIFRLLHARGATLMDKDATGYSVLHYAVLGGSKGLVQFLLEKKLNIFAAAQDGKTAFDLAVEHGHQEILELFFQNMDASQKIALISRQYADGETLLCRAVKSGNTSLVCFLLAGLGGADKVLLLNRPTKRGELPLHEVAKRGLHTIGRFLIQNGASVSSYDKSGSTALHHAIAGGHVDMVRVLLDAGAPVAMQDKNRQTVLDSAQSVGNQTILGLLQQWRRGSDEPSAKRQKRR